MSKIPKILVVDDDPDIVEILSYNLSLAGYQVKSASNGKECVKKAKLFLPEIILLDVMMPEMGGVEACSLLKEIPSLVNTRVIFLSARNEDYTQLSAFDAGADDYISKPVKPKILLKKIASIIKRINVNNNDQQIIILNDFVIDRNKFLITKDNPILDWPTRAMYAWRYLNVNETKYTIGKTYPDYGFAGLTQIKQLSQIALGLDYNQFFHMIYDIKIDENVIEDDVENQCTQCNVHRHRGFL